MVSKSPGRRILPVVIAAVTLSAFAAPAHAEYQGCNAKETVVKSPVGFAGAVYVGLSGPSCTTPVVTAAAECSDAIAEIACEWVANGLATGIGGSGVTVVVQQQLTNGRWENQFVPQFFPPGAVTNASCTAGGGVADIGQPRPCRTPTFRSFFNPSQLATLTSNFRAICTWKSPGAMPFFNTAIQCNLAVSGLIPTGGT